MIAISIASSSSVANRQCIATETGMLRISFNLHSEDTITYASGCLLLCRLVGALGVRNIRHREPVFFLPCSGQTTAGDASQPGLV
ncbi:hypothetical protein XcodCFBP4690_15460 [Xanthomonas codiaei]|uniref:Uncharacterized protein n=1 Tax=Xanthomonas codiaei TaxID=56463 RepID=A0A2S7CJQ8_9XANT|nr:hypothetical protein XcodCFBP4690_15460 [Xanthomonas codiaei]